MKKLFYLFIAVAMIGALASCDEKKSEVKDLAKKFVTALNEQDRLTVYDLYPASKQLLELLPENLETKGMSVEVDDSTGLYTVTFNSELEQRLIFKADSTGTFKIEDSYGVLKFDSISRVFAVKVGIPVKQFTDCEFADIIDENGLFMGSLEYKYFNELHGNLAKETSYWICGRENGKWYARVFQTIKNRGNLPVKGEDYNIEFHISSSRNGVSTTKDVPGVDLAPGEIHEFMIDEPSFYKDMDDRRLNIEIVIRFKNMTKPAMLLKYAKLTGEEYQNYLKEMEEAEERAKKIENGTIDEDEPDLPDDFDSLPDED